MKRVRRRVLQLLALLALPMGVALFPGKAEGVYNPLSVSSTMGCACDQFVEFRDGRAMFHILEDGNSIGCGFYRKGPAGIEWRHPPNSYGAPDEVLARIEPHLLVTKFIYPDGKSEWRWKRWVTAAMRAKMAGARILDSTYERDGFRLITYDSKFKVIETRLIPKPAGKDSGS